jgi:hypothetical protein
VSEGTEEGDCVEEDEGEEEGKWDEEREIKDHKSERANRSAVYHSYTAMTVTLILIWSYINKKASGVYGRLLPCMVYKPRTEW